MFGFISGLAAMAVLTWLLSQRSAESAVENGVPVVRYPPAWRWLAWALFAFPALLATAPLWGRVKPGDEAGFGWLALGFGVGVAVLLREASHRRYAITADGLVEHSPWRRAPRTLPWEAMDQVSYSEAQQMLLIRGGRVQFKLSRYLSGFDTLAQALAQHTRPGFLDAMTLNTVMNLGRR